MNKKTEPETRLADDMYVVEMTVWEHGSGMNGALKVLCKDIITATVVKEGLKKIIPSGVNMHSGDEHIERKFEISISPMTRTHVASFVEEKGY